MSFFIANAYAQAEAPAAGGGGFFRLSFWLVCLPYFTLLPFDPSANAKKSTTLWSLH